MRARTRSRPGRNVRPLVPSSPLRGTAHRPDADHGQRVVLAPPLILAPVVWGSASVRSAVRSAAGSTVRSALRSSVRSAARCMTRAVREGVRAGEVPLPVTGAMSTNSYGREE